MNLEDRFYSESELRGRKTENPEEDKLYSQEEVELISDLFDEFYSIHGDSYSDVDEAYDEFIDAYGNVEHEDINPIIPDTTSPRGKYKITPKQTKVLGGALGAGAGLAASRYVNKGAQKEKDSIEKKMVTGRATSSDIERLDSIKKAIRNRKIAGTVIGAGAGVGATALASKLSKKR